MYKRIFFLLGIFLSVGVLLGYGREVLAFRSQADEPEPTFIQGESVNYTEITETLKLLPPEGDAHVDGRYGRSVLLDGDMLFVGQTQGDYANPNDLPGRVYIYERHSGGPNNWGLTKIITASDTTTKDGFGNSLAIDGNTLIVGAAIANGNANESGAAYIFERNAGGPNNWGRVAKLQAIDGAYWDRFGWTTDLHGDTAVVGARWDDNGNGTNAGAAYVFERNAGGADNWGQVRKILASNGQGADWFGWELSLYQDTLVVGAPYKSVAGVDSGAVYIYERDLGGSDNWGEVRIVIPSMQAANDHFGRSVHIQGDIVAVGAPQTTSSTGAGRVFIFERDHGGANNWGETAYLVASDGLTGDAFGYTVQVETNTIFIGALYADGNTVDTGAAYLFTRNEPNPMQWDEMYKLVASDGVSNDEFGRSVTFWGDSFAVGAYFSNELCPANPNCDSGSAYLFTADLTSDVAVHKAVSRVTAVPGQPLTYTLAFTNNGPDIAFGTVITDLIPNVLSNPSFSSSGATITPTGGLPFVWQVENLAPGSGGVITVTGIISPQLVSETTIVNTAVISNSQDITPTNNSSTAVTQVIIPQINLSASEYVVDEDDGQVMVTAVLSPAQPFLDVTANYATSNGSALAGEDYTAMSGILTFTAGTTEVQILVPILDDQLVEPDEIFTLELSNPIQATLGDMVTAAITILDDDAYPELNLSAPDYTVLESDGQAQLTVNLSHPYPESVSVAYQTADGTALAEEDYTAVSGILTFTAGITEAHILIPILDDQLVESDETFSLALSNPVHATLGGIVNATITILDDDGFPLVSLSSDQYIVPEDGGEAVFTVTLSHVYPEPVSLTYETADGTAWAEEDYTAVFGILTFTVGVTQATFTVPITDDLEVEDDETFTVSLANLTNALPGSAMSAAVTILDNDEEMPPPTNFALYLPLIVRPASTPPPPPIFPIFVSAGVAPRPVTSQGETFYTATIQIPADLPSTGQFFLSADPDQPTAVSVDDELAFVMNGQEIFVKRFSTDGQTIHPEIVSLPRQTMVLMAGQAVTVVFRDVFSDQVSATSLWIVHIP